MYISCVTCKEWSGVQWEAFFRQRSCSGRRNSCPSGCSLPTAPPTLPPSASASSEAGPPAPLPRPPTPLSEGHGHMGESEGVPLMNSCDVSPPPPSCHSVGEEGVGAMVLASGVTSDSVTSSLLGIGIVGSSRSQ